MVWLGFSRGLCSICGRNHKRHWCSDIMWSRYSFSSKKKSPSDDKSGRKNYICMNKYMIGSVAWISSLTMRFQQSNIKYQNNNTVYTSMDWLADSRKGGGGNDRRLLQRDRQSEKGKVLSYIDCLWLFACPLNQIWHFSFLLFSSEIYNVEIVGRSRQCSQPEYLERQLFWRPIYTFIGRTKTVRCIVRQHARWATISTDLI